MGEIQLLVQEIHDRQGESNLEPGTRQREMEAIQKKIKQYNVAQLGELPQEREEGTMRILVCQMGGCASAKTREIKIAATEQLIRKYHVNLCLFMELNYNWSKVNSSANLASWFQDKRERQDASQHTTRRKTTFYLGNINLGGQVCYAGTNIYSKLKTHW